MDAFSMLTVFSESHRLHHGTELKDGVLKPSFEQPSRADTVRDLSLIHI